MAKGDFRRFGSQMMRPSGVVNPAVSRKSALAARAAAVFANECHRPAGAAGGQFCSHGSKVVGNRLASSKPTGAKNTYKVGEGARMDVSLITDDKLKDTKSGPGLISRQAAVPGFEDLAGRTDRAALEEIVKRQTKNIFEVAEMVVKNGPKQAEYTAGWYPFINKYMTDVATDTGLEAKGVIAATAALSASAPWESNVPWTIFLAKNLATNAGPDGGINQKVDAKWAVAHFLAETARGRNPDPVEIAALIGQRLGDLPDRAVADMLRGKHDASGTWLPKKGQFSKGEVRELGDEVREGFGTKGAGTIPQTGPNLTKAVSVLRNPSDANIDKAIGDANKVRSFYQNIRDPRNTEGFDDVTVDTHHFGIANGMPWTISSRFVASGGFNVTGTPGNKATGAHGSYALVVEATRRATAQINKKYGTSYTPNQLQSIVWEGWKDLYAPKSRGFQPMQQSIEAARSAFALYRKTGGKQGISENKMRATIEAARVAAGRGNIPMAELIKRYQREG